jgi:cytochrome c oxidase subunit 2
MRPGLSALFAIFALYACGNGNGPSTPANTAKDAEVISVTAQRWAFEPETLNLKKGVPVTLELTSKDVQHGFNLPDFGVRADALVGQKTRVRLVPDKAGAFAFHCDYYCGAGHEGMAGQIVVE